MCACNKDYYGDGVYCYSKFSNVLTSKTGSNAFSQQVQQSVSNVRQMYLEIPMDPKNVDVHWATILNQVWENVKVSHLLFDLWVSCTSMSWIQLTLNNYLTNLIVLYLFADFNECNIPSICNENAICKDEDGSYLCKCNNGFQGNGKICNGMIFCLNYYLALVTPLVY